MIVNKTEKGYEFLTYTTDEGFLVTLTLRDSGAETLHLESLRAPVSFKPVKLKRGTIKKALGSQRWQNFNRMKKRAFSTTLLL
jgi:hypothetical protein